MNDEIDISFLISLIVLIAMIAFVAWWYWIRQQPSEDQGEVSFISPGYKDKLTLIDGIGVTLESKLNALGVTSFRQIANFTKEDIEEVNKVLSFKGRIEREGWVAQAGKLVEGASRPDGATPQPSPTPASREKASKAPVRKTSGKKASGKKTVTRKSPARTTKARAVKKKAGKKAKKKA